MALATDDLYTGELDAYNGLAVETLRFSSGPGPAGYTTGGGDTPPSTNYPARITTSVLLARTAFAKDRTSGRSTPAAGEIELVNLQGELGLDKYRAYAFDGRAAIVRRGQAAAAYPGGWTPVLSGTMHAPQWTQDGIRIAVHDAQLYASVPIQTTYYAGSNTLPSGLEGTATDLKGKPKPVCIGTVFNVPLPCVNTSKLIYQAHDGSLSSIGMIRDEGVPLSEGMVWTSRNPGFTSQAAHGCAIADDGTMVCVGSGAGSNADAASSVDGGATWTHYTIGAGTGQLNKVHWAAGLFIAVGDNNQIYSSATGLSGSWTLRTTTSAGQTLTDATYGPVAGVGTWLVVGLAGRTRTSTNGTSWSVGTTVGAPTNLNGVAFGTSNSTGLFVAAGDGGTIYTTPDAVTWTSRTSITAGNNNHVDYGNGTWVMVGSAGAVQRSLDAITWTGVAALISANISALRYGNNRWLYGSANGDLVTSTDDGHTWTALTLGIAGPPNIQSIAYNTNITNGGFLISGSTNFAATSDPFGQSYASSADLQDDTKAPSPGTYKKFLDSSGSYIRLGSPPAGQITGDITEGSSQTPAQCWSRSLARAGLSAGSATGNWSAADVTALDLLATGQSGRWYGPDDTGALCGDAADFFAQTAGAAWFADGSGVQRIKQLADPAPNLVSQPDALATSPWAVAGGSPVATNNIGRFAGRSFSRITAANTGPIRQPVTLPANDTYYYRYFIRTNGAAGTALAGIFDNNASAFIAEITATIASDGTITAVATAGTLVRIALLPGGDGVYGIVVKGTGVAAHTNFAYAHVGGTATSVQYSGFELLRGDPDGGTITEDDMWGEPSPVQSADDNEGIPPYRITVQHTQNYTVQTGSQLAGSVSDADRATYGLQWREAAATRAATLTAHPFSQPTTVQSGYSLEADAVADAARRVALLGCDPEWYDVTVEMTTVTQQIELFQKVEWVYHRYGLAAGRRLLVMGITPEAKADGGPITLITFTLWRPLT